MSTPGFDVVATIIESGRVDAGRRSSTCDFSGGGSPVCATGELVVASATCCPTSSLMHMPRLATARCSRATFSVAKRAGESPHAFMLRLLEDLVQAAERFEQFVADARQADQHMQESGRGYAAADVHSYLKARIAGRVATRPKPAQWRK